MKTAAKEKKYYAEDRYRIIMELLNQNRSVDVVSLCQILHTSAVTIRDDLNKLQEKGKLTRTHGGAIITDKSAFDFIFPEKVVCLKEKQEIASTAFSMIHNGDTIFLDTGSTTNELAKLLLSKKDLTVVLYDIRIANLLEHCESNVVLLGGNLRRGLHSTVGPIATRTLSQMRVDKAFITTESVNQDGLATTDIYEAEIKSTAIMHAKDVIVLADTGKFDKVSFNHFASFEDIDTLITDSEMPEEILTKYSGFGSKIIKAAISK